MRTLRGLPVSPGFADGRIYRYEAYACEVCETYIRTGEEQAMVLRYADACRTADAELVQIIGTFSERDADKAKIFTAQREILDDEEMDAEIRAAIQKERLSPDFAVSRVYSDFAAILSRAGDPLIAARSADLCDVRNRLVRILHGEKERNLAQLPGPSVVVAHDLLPSDTATLDRRNVMAIVAEAGGETSHSAILARAFGIPAVLGVPDALGLLPDDSEVIVDAVTGDVLLDPDEQTRENYRTKKRAYDADRADAAQYFSGEAKLKDGTHIDIGLNIGGTCDAESIAACDFIGLFRTEFLYMEKETLPSEEEQFFLYRKIAEQAGGKAITLRTLDIGGDKTLPALPLPREDNPFLGCRALRLCLGNRTLFDTQLRAVLRASAYGRFQIMFPMVGSLDDLRAGKCAVEEAKEQLRRRNIPFDEHIPVGVMIEIPSIAIISELVAKECDFASIGTNDLCQYLHAADRMNPLVSDYYQSFSPSMFLILKTVFDAFVATGKPVSVCGELAGNPLAAPVLAGLGLRKFSMNAASIAGTKRALSRVTLSDAERLAQKVCALDTEKNVLNLLKSENRQVPAV